MKAQLRMPLLAAALVGLATLGAARTAEAALSLKIEVYNGSGVLVQSKDVLTPELIDPEDGSNNLLYSGTVGGVSFSFYTQASSNELVIPADTAYLNLTAGKITNGSGADRRIVITAVADAYAYPTSNSLKHHLSATGIVQTEGSGGFAGDISTAVGKVMKGSTEINSMGVTGSRAAPGTIDFTSLDDETISNPTAFYSMMTQFSGTLKTGASLASFSVNNQLYGTNTPITAVPEPTNIAMAGVGVVLSLGALRRRSRA